MSTLATPCLPERPRGALGSCSRPGCGSRAGRALLRRPVVNEGDLHRTSRVGSQPTPSHPEEHFLTQSQFSFGVWVRDGRGAHSTAPPQQRFGQNHSVADGDPEVSQAQGRECCPIIVREDPAQGRSLGTDPPSNPDPKQDVPGQTLHGWGWGPEFP